MESLFGGGVFMKKIPVTMVRRSLQGIPQYSLPSHFQLKLFTDGDEQDWAKIETKAGEFKTEQQALKRFFTSFGSHLDKMKERCLFIENEQGKKIATATAWYGKFPVNEEQSGRIHWVGVIPSCQGRGLSKPLLTTALNMLAVHYNHAYLTSQTTSYQAIHMYLNFGFQPFINTPACTEAWIRLERILQRKIITR